MNIIKEDYLNDPCRASSIPYWKAMTINVPDGMKIVHNAEYNAEVYADYLDEPYFRLRHDLCDLQAQVLPEGCSVCEASLEEYAAHINSCYDSECVTEAELANYTKRSVYDADLWMAVREEHTGEIVATGIAELDNEMGEGILEWIQVSEAHRGRGLGSYIVNGLLHRMKGKVEFATVSGRCNNPAKPELLYRKCGFIGSDIWHILRKQQ